MAVKSAILDTTELNSVGRSYYCFCLETALTAVTQARALVKGDVIDENHELGAIQRALTQALDVS